MASDSAADAHYQFENWSLNTYICRWWEEAQEREMHRLIELYYGSVVEDQLQNLVGLS